MRHIVVKEGPLVFIRNVLFMELLAVVVFSSISYLENYEMLFRNLGFERYVNYHIFLMVAFSVFEVVYLSVLFLSWYFSYFEITEKEIMRKTGIFFRRRKSVRLTDVVSVEVYQSPLSRLISHATIILEHQNGRETKIKNVSNFDEYAHIIKQMIGGITGRSLDRDIKSLLEEGEGLFVEFKETLRYDGYKGEVNKELERMVLKTIVAFMNADGGTLIIGVNDDGQVTGLQNDYKVLAKKNRDGFENHLSMLIKTMIGLSFARYIHTRFERIDDKEVCIVSVGESHKPAYLRNGDKKEEFFVRVGNSTQPFSMSEAEEYIKTHWK